MAMSMPRSALRHRPITPEIQEWIIATPQRQTKTHRMGSDLASLPQQMHPLVLIGLSMLITLLLLWTIGSILTWGNRQLDTLRYGSPRTTQIDYTVGHGGQPSHFTAWNLHGQVYILEIPLSNPAASHLLTGPLLFGPEADLAPVHLHFVGDPHHPDLLVEAQNIVAHFHNTGTTYVPAAPEYDLLPLSVKAIGNLSIETKNPSKKRLISFDQTPSLHQDTVSIRRHVAALASPVFC